MPWDMVEKLEEDLTPFSKLHSPTRILGDIREAIFDLSILDVDNLPGLFLKFGKGPKDKAAVLVNPSHASDNRTPFFKNLAEINKFQYQFFFDKEKALAWLKEASPANSKKKS